VALLTSRGPAHVTTRPLTMNRLLALIPLLATACASMHRSPAAERPTADAPIAFGVTHRFHSQTLGDEREINVWAPPDDAKGESRCNVLYVIDGGLDQDFLHIAGLGQLALLSGTYGPLIVVGVQTKARRHELTPPLLDPRYVAAFPEGGGAADFRKYMVNEVMPWIESHYRSGPRRALIGESLAGLFVVDTLLREPELFDDYIAISPSLWWDDRALTSQAPELSKRGDLKQRRLALAVGDEGGTMQKAVGELLQALRERPDRYDVRYFDRSLTDTHATIYHAAALEALRWLYATPPIDHGPTPWFMIEGASPPEPETRR
jgi:predicted alpha/beta superfamily hydrolase